MEQDKLAEMVNEVDGEAKQFRSFDDFLATKSNGDPEWKKPVEDVAGSSSESSSEKVEETDDSSKPESAEPASRPIETAEQRIARRQAELRAAFIPGPNANDPAAHPMAPNVTAEPGPYKPVETIPNFLTELSISEVTWVDGDTTVSVNETQVLHRDPESLNSIFIDGRNFAVGEATIEDIIKHYHKLDDAILKLRNRQQGVRAGLEEKLKTTKGNSRARLKELDRVATNNMKQATRLKTERAASDPVAKVQAEIKKGAQALLDAGMFETLDEAIESVKAKRVKKGLPV